MTIQLKNNFFLMRHGIAVSNIENRYSTNLEKGLIIDPLTSEGKEGVLKNIQLKAKEFNLGVDTIIYASPYLRTKQTAEIVQSYLNCNIINFDADLRERECGDFDGLIIREGEKAPHREADTTIDSHYRNVESLKDMWQRMFNVIQKVDQQFQDRNIIIVSHGDPLNCLYCGIKGENLLNFMTAFPKFINAEIRPAN